MKIRTGFVSNSSSSSFVCSIPNIEGDIDPCKGMTYLYKCIADAEKYGEKQSINYYKELLQKYQQKAIQRKRKYFTIGEDEEDAYTAEKILKEISKYFPDFEYEGIE